MLQQRILATLNFFGLQSMPLTLFELHKFLLADLVTMKPRLNDRFELDEFGEAATPVSLAEVLSSLEILEKSGEVIKNHGYYALPGHENLITERLENYAVYGLKRERRIRRFLPFLRFVPFVRGAAVGGSQAMGQETATSDIDLLVITDPKYIWLARTLVTGYFQMFGVRRHGQKIANRFCLNHYLAGPHELDEERDPYNAMEYLRLRAQVYPSAIVEFVGRNANWIRGFFPEIKIERMAAEPRPALQRATEKILDNGFGRWLETKLGAWQLARIQKGEHAVATGEELSFHSKDRKYKLLREFFA